jgi:phosphoglycolate phosphatase-like HAD superfamily hydrolase
VVTAGLSCLTQMEYGIRRAVELGNVPSDAVPELTDAQRATNSDIARRIARGEERFDDTDEPVELTSFIAERAPRLFRLYEKVLNAASRDRNTADAKRNPARWRVPGSMAFLRHLKAVGCLNYFVTGSVIYEEGGMHEEIRALGFETGPGRLVESLVGSSWDRKLPKDEVMHELFEREGIDPACVLSVGDGRTEIAAAVRMGCVAMSRLEPGAARLRQMHRKLGTNYIVPDYTSPALMELVRKE